MSEKQPIHHHLPFAEAGEHNHTGMRSHLRGLAEAANKIRDYRRERTVSHEQGHGFVGGFYPEGEGTEIELFAPERRTDVLEN